MTTIQEIQEIMDWCDNMCWRFPWASAIFVARAKERIADLRAE